MPDVLALPQIALTPPVEADGTADGTEALRRLMTFADQGLEQFCCTADGQPPMAAVSRIRGTGLGVSFGRLVRGIEAAHPLTLAFPFEGTDSIGGAVWRARDFCPDGPTTALAKLHFLPGTDQLPLHWHHHSERFIMVLEGRGFFHLSDSTPGQFNGSDVRSVPIRSRDVLAFTRGLLHTFSTQQEPLTLLSYQSPFVPFEDPDQYSIPRHRWTPAMLAGSTSRIAIDPAWSVITRADAQAADHAGNQAASK